MRQIVQKHNRSQLRLSTHPNAAKRASTLSVASSVKRGDASDEEEDTENKSPSQLKARKTSETSSAASSAAQMKAKSNQDKIGNRDEI